MLGFKQSTLGFENIAFGFKQSHLGLKHITLGLKQSRLGSKQSALGKKHIEVRRFPWAHRAAGGVTACGVQRPYFSLLTTGAALSSSSAEPACSPPQKR